ncbi:hypothetical protein CHLRE_16g687602v5 [Chlamydomonas reinhardtii]|uniref:Uncharacterized protein n=1 Tax=Chlamydomonas reinhardtii TaxID=3055 RepID=A0A2K3CUL7_CHLRE|nr:uncharacterized protein CHLRE_16g687602v5 [Chlamydomonas reinhardtii]PNW71977.1 hypothetical protein CHLRE_16g687602v5 [Chlamydomonas reinhardtii]
MRQALMEMLLDRARSAPLRRGGGDDGRGGGAGPGGGDGGGGAGLAAAAAAQSLAAAAAAAAAATVGTAVALCIETWRGRSPTFQLRVDKKRHDK